VVAKPKPVRGKGEASQNSQAIEYGSWQSIEPSHQLAVSMSYAEGSGYEKGQSSHASGVAGDDAGGEIQSDDEDEVCSSRWKRKMLTEMLMILIHLILMKKMIPWSPRFSIHGIKTFQLY
jgi:hypothetical protein